MMLVLEQLLQARFRSNLAQHSVFVCGLPPKTPGSSRVDRGNKGEVVDISQTYKFSHWLYLRQFSRWHKRGKAFLAISGFTCPVTVSGSDHSQLRHNCPILTSSFTHWNRPLQEWAKAGPSEGNCRLGWHFHAANHQTSMRNCQINWRFSSRHFWSCFPQNAQW